MNCTVAHYVLTVTKLASYSGSVVDSCFEHFGCINPFVLPFGYPVAGKKILGPASVKGRHVHSHIFGERTVCRVPAVTVLHSVLTYCNDAMQSVCPVHWFALYIVLKSSVRSRVRVSSLLRTFVTVINIIRPHLGSLYHVRGGHCWTRSSPVCP